MSTFNITGLIKVTFQGANGSGSPVNISVPGLKVGDSVVRIVDTGGGDETSLCELVVSTDGYIKQTFTGDASTTSLIGFLMRFA